MFPDERLELRHRLGVTAERELGFEAKLDGDEAELLEPRRLVAGECFVAEVRQRRTAPEAERPPQHFHSLLGVPVCHQPAALAQKLLERVEVERTWIDAKRVAERPCLDHIRPERLA